MSEAEVIRCAGVDAAMYLKILRMGALQAWGSWRSVGRGAPVPLCGKHGLAGMGVCLLVGHPDSTTALNTLLYCTDPTSAGVEVFLLVGFLVLVIILPINCVGDEVDNLIASVSAPTRSRCW